MDSPFSYQRPELPILTPRTPAEAAECIRQAVGDKQAILTRGGGTKWRSGRQPTDSAVILDTRALIGILEYEPGELTFTALAGTPLAEIEQTLAAKGQYLPFDPPFGAAGATLGGMVAAGLSGPRRMRYGGLRDFILGIHYLDSRGGLVRSGGKVVKNAAGFDFSKLFCGSLGTLGVLTQVSFKVFPLPQARRTLLIGLADAPEVQKLLLAVQRSPLEVSAADAWPSGTLAASSSFPEGYTVAIQLDGTPQSLEPRMKGLRALAPSDVPTQLLEGEAEWKLWEALRDVNWIGTETTVVRLVLPANKLAELDRALNALRARRVYSLAGNAAWIALNAEPSSLNPALELSGAQGVVWRAAQSSADVLPALSGAAIVKRVKDAFDPDNRFFPGRYAV